MDLTRFLTDDSSRPRRRILLGVLLLLVISLSGCVRRRMTIRSNPPGAAVYLDDQEVGTTPVTVDFTYYGTRKIQLIKDGYDTLTVKQAFYAPWYQWPPLDFVSENLSPQQYRDEHLLNFQLVPQQILPAETLLERAQQLRNSTSQGYVPALPNGTALPQPVAPLGDPSGAAPGGPQPILPLPPPSDYNPSGLQAPVWPGAAAPQPNG